MNSPKRSNKALLITLEYPPEVGGVGRMYKELVDASGGQIAVWSASAGSVFQAALLATSGWPRWRTALVNLRQILRQRTYGTILVGQVLPLGIPVYLLSFFYDFRYCVFVHGLDLASPKQSWRKRAVASLILKRAHRVYAANRNVATLATDYGVDKKQITLVYPSPGITPARFPYMETPRDHFAIHHAPCLLTVARLVERKGIDVCLRALDKIWRVFPDTNYIIIGAGPDQERLRSLTANLRFPKQVHFLGRLTDQEIAGYLRRADLFIMTPRTLSNGDVEGAGIVYLEAGSFGLATVASRSGGVPEIVVDGVTGIVLPENDPSATAEAVIKLLTNQELRKQYGLAAKQQSEKFKPDSMVKRILQDL